MLPKLRAALDVLSTLLVILAAGVLLWRVILHPSEAPGTRQPIKDVRDRRIEPGLIRHTRGTGRLALVEFSDYECPFCARHATSTEPELNKLFVDVGRLRHVVLNYPLAIHPRAEKAGIAAECAAKQGRFWEMHNALFSSSAKLDLPDLASHSLQLGLDTDAFTKCLSDPATSELVQMDVDEGRRLGISSTPSFFLGRISTDGGIELLKQIDGARPLKDFQAAIEELLRSESAE